MGAPGACTPEVCAAYDADLPPGCLGDATDDAAQGGDVDGGAVDGLTGDGGLQEVGSGDAGAGPEPTCVLDGDCLTTAACKVARCRSGACVEENAAENLPCDDGDPCTEGDRCVGGACVASPKSCDDGMACTADSCDPSTGQCLHDTSSCGCTPATAAADCDDDNPCTADACVDGACSSVPAAEGESCDDGDPCTEGDHCQAGVCAGAPKDCSDGLTCSVDACDGATGQCLHDTSSCGCTPATAAADCDDDNPCTADACVDGACSSAPAAEGESCDDGDPCTEGDHCQAGVCAGTAKDCSDGLTCSVDACDGATGQCLHDTSSCGCTPATAAADCDDDNPCTTASCSAAGACVSSPAPAGTPCDDGDPCTVGDHCEAGVCAHDPKDCDDGIACTADACDGATGQCLHDTSSCGCAPGSAAVDCDDQNPCTADTCTEALECAHMPLTGGGVACSDGDPCTLNDACQAGVCLGAAKSCDDGIACTADACDPATGQCAFDDVACECLTAADCDDHEPCTSDLCQPDRTCAHTPLPNDMPCQGDGTVTGAPEAPISGACHAGVCRGVRDVSVGMVHGCAVLETGGVRCWGNGGAWLGTGEPNDHPTPVPVDLGAGPDGQALAVTAGTVHTCALVQAGHLRCWGDNGTGQLGAQDTVAPDNGPAHPASLVVFNLPVTTVSAGCQSTCATTSDGRVRCWGWGVGGVLGSGDTEDRMDVTGTALAWPATQQLGAAWVGTSEGLFTKVHTCALLTGGDVRCWGQGGHGALGTGATDDLMDEPGEVPSLLALGAVALSVGWESNCVTTAAGAVRCWGAGKFGMLGTGATDDLMDDPGEGPSTVPLPGPAVAVAVGASHACAIVQGGEVYCWGYRDGLGAPAGAGTGDLLDEPGEAAYLVDLGAGERAERLSASHNGTCALLASRQVKCWGNNFTRALGYGDGVPTLSPPPGYVNVMGAPGSQCADGAECLSGACQGAICQ